MHHENGRPRLQDPLFSKLLEQELKAAVLCSLHHYSHLRYFFSELRDEYM